MQTCTMKPAIGASCCRNCVPQQCFVGQRLRVPGRRRCAAVTSAYKIAVLPGDGIGPEISKVAIDVLSAAGNAENVQMDFTYGLIGGAAIDALGSPFPPETLQLCKSSDAVLLAAIGG